MPRTANLNLIVAPINLICSQSTASDILSVNVSHARLTILIAAGIFFASQLKTTIRAGARAAVSLFTTPLAAVLSRAQASFVSADASTISWLNTPPSFFASSRISLIPSSPSLSIGISLAPARPNIFIAVATFFVGSSIPAIAPAMISNWRSGSRPLISPIDSPIASSASFAVLKPRSASSRDFCILVMPVVSSVKPTPDRSAACLSSDSAEIENPVAFESLSIWSAASRPEEINLPKPATTPTPRSDFRPPRDLLALPRRPLNDVNARPVLSSAVSLIFAVVVIVLLLVFPFQPSS